MGGRYLCSVAALNAADEVGPPTPDVNSLPFPNPCAVCGPSPQAMGLSQPMGYPAFTNDYMTQDPDMGGLLGSRLSPTGPGFAQASQQSQEHMNYQYDRQPPPPQRDERGVGPYVSP